MSKSKRLHYGNHPNGTMHKRDLNRGARMVWPDDLKGDTKLTSKVTVRRVRPRSAASAA